VTLKGAEFLLHNSAYRRGQGEGLTQGAGALRGALQHIEAQDGGIALLAKLKPTFQSVADQLEAQGRSLQLEQNTLLGQYIVAKQAETEAAKMETARIEVNTEADMRGIEADAEARIVAIQTARVGWVVKLWRWAFAT
jgi:hypothetical protein